MPLVTPQNNSDNPTELWATKLVGKTLSDDSHSETVRTSPPSPRPPCDTIMADVTDATQNFCKKDLPESHRIIHPGSMVTMDFRPDRLNVHVKEDGTVAKVTHS